MTCRQSKTGLHRLYSPAPARAQPAAPPPVQFTGVSIVSGNRQTPPAAVSTLPPPAAPAKRFRCQSKATPPPCSSSMSVDSISIIKKVKYLQACVASSDGFSVFPPVNMDCIEKEEKRF